VSIPPDGYGSIDQAFDFFLGEILTRAHIGVFGFAWGRKRRHG